MKVGNIVSGLEVVDVKRVNKLNLIQFLKEVDSYLQQGYRIDVNSARQVGLVLQADMFKTEASSSPKVGTTGVKEEEVETVVPKVEQETEAPVENTSVDSKPVEDVAVEPEKPVKKPTTTRSKKIAQ